MTITWEPHPADASITHAIVRGVVRGSVRRASNGWYGRCDYTDGPMWPDTNTQVAARALVESAIRDVLGAT